MEKLCFLKFEYLGSNTIIQICSKQGYEQEII